MKSLSYPLSAVDSQIDIQLKAEPLSVMDCYNFVVDEHCGGIDLFVGTVRRWNKGHEITKLEFESYAPMALAELKKIADYVKVHFEAKKISIHHRIGTVGITEIAVVIAVSCKHRSAAFDASAYLIDTLKEKVPIWKKEYKVDGSYWVNARP